MSADTGWSLRALEELAHRLRQQLDSYETLHSAEARALQGQWEKQQRIQQDELHMLRQELAQLEEGIAALRSSQSQWHGATGSPARTEPDNS